MPNQPAPRSLGAAGRKLWRSIASEYTLRADELSILEDACRETDIIERLEDELKDSPLMVKGSMGQLVASPLVSEVRQHRNTKRSALMALRLPDGEGSTSAEARSEAGRAMNIIRWGARGTKSG